MRLGLFGGSFNPIHLGHLFVAHAAREELSLDRICFIPAAQSPFKPDARLAPGPARARLMRLALAGMTFAEVDEQELSRGGVSYSIDTVRNYAGRFPGARLFWLIGGDHVSQLPLWRDADELARLTEFVVITRPGVAPGNADPRFRCHLLKGCPISVSSSDIRLRIRERRPYGHMLAPAVAEMIANNALYL